MSMPQSTATESLAMALQQAMQCQQQGQLDAAQAIYQQVLDDHPRQADALHLLGVLHAQRRDFARAHELIWQAITVNPDEAMFHNNLANVCVERGLPDEAEPLYARAIELDNARIDALSNLGLLMSRTHREVEAEALFARAVELDPANPDWRHNLANLYLRLGRIPEALQLTHDGLITTPRSRILRAMLAQSYIMLDQRELAAEVLRAWIQSDPDDPYPHHHLPACTGEQVPERASDRYVASVFDSFAGSFDVKLAKLSYQAPGLVAAEVARRCGPPAARLKVLDAGCGTGLCGPLLAPFASQLDGVDLSEGMLRLAVERHNYDGLYKGELVAFLQASPAGFDTVVSADTLCYFGALEGFAAAVVGALRPAGLLVFTAEALADETPESSYRLKEHGRYSHSRRYILSALLAAGLLSIDIQPVVLRNEGGLPVDGWLVSAQAIGPR